MCGYRYVPGVFGGSGRVKKRATSTAIARARGLDERAAAGTRAQERNGFGPIVPYSGRNAADSDYK